MVINKFVIIYRNEGKIINIEEIVKFRKQCKIKKIAFLIDELIFV